MDGHFGIPPTLPPAKLELSEAVFERLDPLAGPRDRVLSTNIDVAMGGGFLTPGINWSGQSSAHLLDRERMQKQQRHLNRARHHLDPRDLVALDVKFLVLSPGDIGGLS